MKLGLKIFLLILITTFVIYGGAILIITYNFRTLTFENSNKIADIYALNAANKIKTQLEIDLQVTRTIRDAFYDYENIGNQLRQIFHENILTNSIKSNPEYLSSWMSWELQSINPDWEKPYGRIRTAKLRERAVVTTYIDTVDIDGDQVGSMYYKIKKGFYDEFIVDPYFFTYAEEAGESILKTTIGCALRKEGRLVAVVAEDIPTGRFQEIIENIAPFDSSYAMLLANNGAIVAHPNKKNIGKEITLIYKEFTKQNNILENIRLGKKLSFEAEINSQNHYITIQPIEIGETYSPWALAIIVPEHVIIAKTLKDTRLSIIIGILGLIIIAIIILILASYITNPLNKTTEILNQLDKGVIDTHNKLNINRKDEIGQMAVSVNRLIETLNNTAEFAKKIGEGNLETKYEPLSNEDTLGNALLEMRKNLIKAKEEEINREIENKKTNWTQNGIAQISELLREYNDNMEEFAYSITSYLVKYMEANQGGLFIIQDDDKENPYIEIKAAYAYDRKKLFESKLEMEEGLIGRAIKEKETIYIDEVPDGYLYIGSGLGEKTAKCLILVPLVFENEVFGVIEIASFKELEQYKINFLERVGERVASTVSNIKKNVRTSELLKQSQNQSIELANQEKEMRESFRELQIAQEAAIKREMETQGLMDAIQNSALVIQYDLTGKIISFNESNLKQLGFEKADFENKYHKELEQEATSDSVWYKRFWDDLKKGKSRKHIYKLINKKGERWFSASYTPIASKEGLPYKVISVAFDITENKKLEEKITILENEINSFKTNNG